MRAKQILSFAITITFLVHTSISHAHDLGTQGEVFPIQEVDIRLIMAKEFANLNVMHLHDLMSKSARDYTSHLTPAPLT